MIKMIQTELWKMIHQKSFYVALGIGVFLSLWDSLDTFKMVQEMIPGMLRDSVSRVYEGIGLFGLWMSVTGGMNMGSYIFKIIWPILAAIPFGWSYWSERKEGSFYQIVTRSGKMTYFLMKYLTVFISGGIVIATPLLLNLLTDAMFCPVYPPSPVNSYYAVSSGIFLSKLFYTQPWLYSFVWIAVVFLQGGVTACLCFVLGDYPPFGVVVTLFPFAFYMMIGTLTSMLLIPDNNVKFLLHPLLMVYSSPGTLNPAWLIFTYIIVLGMFSWIMGYYQVVRKEL